MTDPAGVDMLLVEVSSSGVGGPWTEIARHETDGGLAWRTNTLTTADFNAAAVPLTGTMRLRFTANDANPQSTVEAGIDAFDVSEFRCPGDLNCDGVVDHNDVGPFALALTDPNVYNTTFPGCDITRADMNGDGSNNGLDIPFLVATLLAP